MSFWPFSNSYSNNSNLLKLLDLIADFSTVTVDNLLDDRTLQEEFLSELKTLSLKAGHKSSFQLVQLLLGDSQLAKSVPLNTNSDAVSVSSSNNDLAGGSLSKNAREAKLLELLLQPHILNGFLDYIVLSVDYYHEIANSPESQAAKLSIQAEDDEDFETRHRRLAAMMGEDEEDNDERLRRCMHCSAEVLLTDMWMISNRIIETPIIMDKLWLVMSLPNLEESSPSVTYLVQIMDHLMDLNSIELLNYIRRQDTLVDTFLNKIEIPILMDFFLKIIQTDKADSPTGILEVLDQQDLIPKLVNILRPALNLVNEDSDFISNHEQLFRQTAATEFIKALVTISSNASLAVDLDTNIGPNQLTRELASPAIVRVMIEDIILARLKSDTKPEVYYSNKHGINNCVAILIELIRKNNSDYDLNCGTYSSQLQTNEGTGEVSIQVMFLWLKDFEQNPPGPRDPVYLGGLLNVFSEHLDDLVHLMDIEPHVPPTLNNSLKFLGVTKFKISELIAELLHCSNMILLNSRKIASVVSLRDKMRNLQENNLQAALDDTILDTPDKDIDMGEGSQILGVTSRIDEVSLQDEHPHQPKKLEASELMDQANVATLSEDQHYRKMIGQLEFEDSDDDEPAVSAENPFVNSEREEQFRQNPCLGDKFKISLKDLGMLSKIVSKFTEYPWHNFFHNVIFDLIQQIFNGKLNSFNSFLIAELFKLEECSITEVIVESFKEEVLPRPGYMGHLILVSEEVVKFTSLYKPALISSRIVEAVGSKDWEWFVNDILLKTRELYNVILGADSEYLDDDEDDREGGEEEAFGFDSSTVGYMDLEPYENRKPIILGDISNHDEFVLLQAKEDADKEDELLDEDLKISNVPIEKMSPKQDFENDDFAIYDEFEGNKFSNLQENDYLDNLLGSSSSDEEEDSHQLRRVPKHYD